MGAPSDVDVVGAQLSPADHKALPASHVMNLWMAFNDSVVCPSRICDAFRCHLTDLLHS
jgi:hypothetical protein